MWTVALIDLSFLGEKISIDLQPESWRAMDWGQLLGFFLWVLLYYFFIIICIILMINLLIAM